MPSSTSKNVSYNTHVYYFFAFFFFSALPVSGDDKVDLAFFFAAFFFAAAARSSAKARARRASRAARAASRRNAACSANRDACVKCRFSARRSRCSFASFCVLRKSFRPVVLTFSFSIIRESAMDPAANAARSSPLSATAARAPSPPKRGLERPRGRQDARRGRQDPTGGGRREWRVAAAEW